VLESDYPPGDFSIGQSAEGSTAFTATTVLYLAGVTGESNPRVDEKKMAWFKFQFSLEEIKNATGMNAVRAYHSVATTKDLIR